MALCANTALAGAMPRLCVRGARGRFGGVRAGTWRRVSFVSPSPPRVFRAACGGPSRPGVPYPRSLVRHSMWSVRSARSVRLPFWLSPRVPFVCVRSRSRGVRSPPRWVVWRAHLAWSRHWALVGPFHVVRAPPRVLPRSLAPSGVLGGGRSGHGSPLLGLGLWGRRQGVPGGVPSTVARGVWGLALLLPRLPVHWMGVRGPRCGRGRAGVGALLCLCGGCAPRGGSMAFLCWGAGWGGGGGRAPFPPAVRPGRGLLGGGSLCLFLSLCLPWAGNKAGVTGVVLSMGGVAPHTTPVRAHPASLGTICAASRCAGVGPLVLRGPHVSRRLGRGGGSHSGSPLGRGGPIPPASGVGGRGPRGWRAGGGAGGGGAAPRPPCSRSGRRPAVLLSGPLCVAGALPSGARVRSGLKCRPGVGGDEGRPVDRSPGGPS